MKIVIDKIEHKEDYLDEAYFIMNKYKLIYKNPYRRIFKKTTNIIRFLIFLVLYLIAVTALSIIDKSFIYYICIGISIVCIALAISKYLYVKKYIKTYSESKTNSELDINEKEVILHNKVIKQETTINWEDIDKILVSKYCIVFMQKIKKTAPYVAITVPREVESKVIKGLDKYNKKDLLIYNKKTCN